MQIGPTEDGQAAMAVLVEVDEGFVACCAGVEVAEDVSWLLLLNGAQADSISPMTTIGSIRLGTCI
jgi:hypothetical protein